MESSQPKDKDSSNAFRSWWRKVTTGNNPQQVSQQQTGQFWFQTYTATNVRPLAHEPESSFWSSFNRKHPICPCSYCLCRRERTIRRLCSMYRCQMRFLFEGSRYCHSSNMDFVSSRNPLAISKTKIIYTISPQDSIPTVYFVCLAGKTSINFVIGYPTRRY